MIWRIAKKEFLLNLMTFKFSIGTLLCVVLMAVFMPVLVSDYQQRLKDHHANVAANDEELHKVKVYMNITPTIYRPPTILSIFSKGLEKRLGCPAKIELYDVSQSGDIMDAVVTDEPPHLLSIFPLLDISLIFKVAMSILSLLLAYDVISGEREQGTLRLMLSNATSRAQVLLGKMSAGLMTLVLSVTMSFLVGFLILRFFSMVALSRSDYIRTTLIYLVSLIFVSVIFNLGLLISCLCRRSAVSLTLGIFIWLFLAVLLPNASACLASHVKPVKATHEFDETINELNEECNKDIEKSIKGIRQRGGNESYASGAFGRKYLIICEGELKGYKQECYAMTEPIRIKYMKRIREIREGHFGTCIQQKKLARLFSQWSPMTLYENMVSVLSMTDLNNVQYLNAQVKLYTDEVIEYVRSKTNDFRSLVYFTTCTEQDWHEAVDHFLPYLEAENEAVKDRYMDEIKQWYVQKIRNMPSLDLQDFPAFIYRPPGIAQSLKGIMMHLGLLISMSVVFFGVAFVALLKYDIR